DEGPVGAVAALPAGRDGGNGEAELDEPGAEQGLTVLGRIEPALDRLFEAGVAAGDVLAHGAVVAGGADALAQGDAKVVRELVAARHQARLRARCLLELLVVAERRLAVGRARAVDGREDGGGGQPVRRRRSGGCGE